MLDEHPIREGQMTQCPATLNFRFFQHATFSETITLKDSDGVARDLTAHTALMHVRRYVEDDTPLFTLSTDDGSIVLGGVAGTIALAIPFTDTDLDIDWDGEVWFHDLLLTNTTPDPDVVERSFQGAIIAMPGVTRP